MFLNKKSRFLGCYTPLFRSHANTPASPAHGIPFLPVEQPTARSRVKCQGGRGR